MPCFPVDLAFILYFFQLLNFWNAQHFTVFLFSFLVFLIKNWKLFINVTRKIYRTDLTTKLQKKMLFSNLTAGPPNRQAVPEMAFLRSLVLMCLNDLILSAITCGGSILDFWSKKMAGKFKIFNFYTTKMTFWNS